MNNKGTIIEINGKRAIIMTEHCQFKEIKINGWQKLGDQVTFSSADIIVATPRYQKVVGLVASFVLVLFLAFTVFQTMFTTNNAYAYIGIDVNPSLEIGIDEDLKVTSITSYDDKTSDDTYRFLLNKNVEQVLRTIVTQYQYDNVLSTSQKNYIAVSVYLNNENKNDKTLETIKNILGNDLKQKALLATVYYYKVDKETRQAAINNNVSPIKYLLREECKRKGIPCESNTISLKNAEINKVAGQLKQFKSQQQIDFNQQVVKPLQNQERNNNHGQRSPPPVNQKQNNIQNKANQNRVRNINKTNVNNETDNYNNETPNTPKNVEANNNKGADNNQKANVDQQTKGSKGFEGGHKPTETIEPGPRDGAGNGKGGR